MAKGDRNDAYQKDRDAVLDFAVDWAAFLTAAGADTLFSSDWTATPSGSAGDIVIDNEQVDGAKAIVWLSGGTRAKKYALMNRIVTTQGRTNDKTIYVTVLEH